MVEDKTKSGWNGRVQLVWWAPGAAPLWVAVGMIVGVVATLRGESASPSALAGLGMFWVGFLVWHYWERHQILEHFWRTLRPNWEDLVRMDGGDPEQVLAAHVRWYNERYYHVPVVRMSKGKEGGA